MPERGDPVPSVAPMDVPPKDGWRDWNDAQLDPETVDEGNWLGETIDPDDDDDNGLGGTEAGR